jgi:hypothetical protein
MFPGDGDNLRYLFCVSGDSDYLGCCALDRTIVLIDQQLFRLLHDVSTAQGLA